MTKVRFQPILPEQLMATPSLADLRQEIDRIDAAMHDLLMERGTIIDTLIEVKKTQDSGSAFRPGREASMMRALAERHRGHLPFDTVESIWRVIISTFTYVQAPYSVHADISIGDAAMRDTARFHFGFTVPYHTHQNAAAVIGAIADAAGDLGLFAATTQGAWWRDLIGPNAPKIIARLPFVERPDHPASLPVFVISKPLADAAIRERVLHACGNLSLDPAQIARLQAHDVSVEATHDRSVLISAPGQLDHASLNEAFRQIGASGLHMDEVGSHANRFHLKTI